MKKIFTLLTLSLCLQAMATPAGDLNLNANSLKLKVYRMAVSTNANCTSPIIVIDNGSSPIETDVKGFNPRFGTGNIDDGTYPCVMFEIADTIKYSGESSVSGNCSPTSETARDLCRLDNSGTTQLLDGTTFNCTNSEDKVVLYLSTNTVVSPSGNGFVAPVGGGSQDGGHLGAALIVAAGGVAKLSVNTDGYLCDKENNTGSDCDGTGTDSGTAACRLNGADFTFTTL